MPDKTDYEQLSKRLLVSAQKGSIQAQYHLGVLYNDGRGVPKDYEQAASWYLKAAQQGHPKAQLYLALLYQNGRGVARDYKQAVQWFTKSAEQGEQKAQYYLGVLYHKGIGVEHDDETAAEWLDKAAEQGHAEAQKLLNKILEEYDAIGPEDSLSDSPITIPTARSHSLKKAIATTFACIVILSIGCGAYYYTYRSNPEKSQTKIVDIRSQNYSSISLKEVFKLAEKGSPDELKRAVKRGAYFNIKVGLGDTADMSESDTPDLLFDVYDTPLHHAAANNKNPASIRFLISLGLDVNASASSGNGGYNGTPLSCAVEALNVEAVRELLRAGANPNAYCKSSDTGAVGMFQLLAGEASSNKRVVRDIVEMLIKAGGDINAHEEFRQDEKMSAADIEAMIEFRKLEASRTNLILAVLDDNPDFVEILLDAGANPNIRDLTNKIALDYAIELADTSRLKMTSSLLGRLKALTTEQTGKGVLDHDSMLQLNEMLAEGKVPDYVRDKGQFFYNKEYENGCVEIKGTNVRLRSQPNTNARIIDTISAGDFNNFPFYLGEWTNPNGDRWVVADYKGEAVWLFGQYTALMTAEQHAIMSDAIAFAEEEEKYSGGYGPRVKGLQLGMKMSLQDMVDWGNNNLNYPFNLRINLNRRDEQEKNAITINVTAANSFSIVKATGTFSKYKNNKQNNLIASLDKEKIKNANLAYHISINANKKVDGMHFEKEDFGVPLLYPDQQFLREFRSNYNIPAMAYNDLRKSFFGLFLGNYYYYVNANEGWEIRFYPGDNGIPAKGNTVGSLLFGLKGITIEAIRTNNKSGGFN